MIAERNEAILDTLSGSEKKVVEKSINTIYQIVDTLDLSA
jgi:hypothetical protein